VTPEQDKSAAIESLLYQEAALLDRRDYVAWLELIAQDATYWIPASHDDVTPSNHLSVVYDDRARLERRVERLGSRFAYAQHPPSVTVRSVTNVVVTLDSAGQEAEVDAVLLLFELRYGKERTYPARCRYRMTLTSDGWRIREKVVRLLAAEEHLDELAFIV
jgi:benzoate/toluate 1,2-dioxygenase subunit beta